MAILEELLDHPVSLSRQLTAPVHLRDVDFEADLVFHLNSLVTVLLTGYALEVIEPISRLDLPQLGHHGPQHRVLVHDYPTNLVLKGKLRVEQV